MLLVHGAGSGPWVFEGWSETFRSLSIEAVDLQEGLDVAAASMEDYARRVVAAARRLPQPVALCGWSMGGLVVLQAAGPCRAHSVILIEASPPGEVQGFRHEAPLALGAFDPEEVYGPFPEGMPVRPESSLARTERKRGISIPRLACPSLVVCGDEFRWQRGRAIADYYGSSLMEFPGSIIGPWSGSAASGGPSRGSSMFLRRTEQAERCCDSGEIAFVARDR